MFDCNPTLHVRSVFLDITKAFEKMWHEGLLYKLRSMGIWGELYNRLENYLSGSIERLTLNGKNSSSKPVLVGVSKGSILRPLLSLVCINDLSNIKPYADENFFFIKVRDKNESAKTLNNDVLAISKRAYNWKMLLYQILANQSKKSYFQWKIKFKFIQP